MRRILVALALTAVAVGIAGTAMAERPGIWPGGSVTTMERGGIWPTAY